MRLNNKIIVLLLVIISSGLTAQPSNDDCSGAINVPVDSICTSPYTFMSNWVNGTPTDSGVATSCSSYAGGDLWYKFTVPGNSTDIILEFIGFTSTSLYGPYLMAEIYSSDCTSLNPVTCDYIGRGGFRRYDNLDSDSTYYIRFYEKDNNQNFSIEFCMYTPPANEVCLGAINVSVAEGSCSTPTVVPKFATANRSTNGTQCSSYSSIDRDLWYKFTVPPNRKVVHLDISEVYATDIIIYENSCNSLNRIYCSGTIYSPTTKTVYDLVSDSTYYLRMIASKTNQINNEFCIYTTPSPPNEICTSATTILPALDSCNNNIVVGHNIWANDSNETNVCGVSTYNSPYKGGDVWYEFTMPTGRYGAILDLTRTIPGADIYVEIYEGSCGSLNTKYCSTEIVTNSPHSIPNLLPDSTYYFRFYDAYNNNQDTFEYCLYTSPPPPANNWCGTGAVVTVGLDSCDSNIVTASNLGASDSGEIGICGAANYNGGDIWYSATVPTGRVGLKIDMLSTVGNMYLEVYENSCGSLNPIYCSNELVTTYDEYIYFLEGDSTYYLRFFEDGFNASGSFEFCVYSPLLPPSNDICSGAISLSVGQDSCSFTYTVDNSSATDSNIPICSSFPSYYLCSYGGGDLWYEFTMPNDISEIYYKHLGQNTAGYGYWCYQIFENSCDSLIATDCQNGAGSNSTNSSLVTGLDGDSTYYLRIFENHNNINGTSEFCLFYDSPPINNYCEYALDLTVGNCQASTYLGTNISASDSEEIQICGSGNYQGHDIWYTFLLPPGENSVILNLVSNLVENNSDGKVMVELYSGACGSLVYENCSQSLTSNNPIFYNNLNSTNTYYLRFYEDGNDKFGAFSFKLLSGSLQNLNNDPTTAEQITVGIDSCSSFVYGNNYLATDSYVPSPSCGSSHLYKGGDMWYRFSTDPNVESIEIDFISMPGNLYGVIYEADTTNTNPKAVKCFNGFSTSSNSVINDLTGSTDYLLRIYEAGNNAFGCFEFCLFSNLVSSVYTVNTSDDIDDGTCDSNHCSYREAILASNADGQISKINFNIPGAGPHQINLGSDFPEIENHLTIDAATQPNWTLGEIVIDASGSGLEFFNGNYYMSTSNPGSAGSYDLSLYGLELKGLPIMLGGGVIGYEGKENQFYSDSPVYIENNVTIQNNYFDDGGIINGAYAYLGSYDYMASSGLICNNHFYNDARIEVESCSADILYNKFGKKPDGTVTGGLYAIYETDPAYLFDGTDLFGSIKYNEFHELNGIVLSEQAWEWDYLDIRENSYYCNIDPSHTYWAYYSPSYLITEPVEIIATTQDGIIGKSENAALNADYDPYEEVHIYLTINPNCTNGSPCQGEQYLGSTFVDPISGLWGFDYSFNTGDQIVAYSEYWDGIQYFQNYTPFSSCFTFALPSCSHTAGDTITYVTNTSDSGPGSLRNAIECANYDSSLDFIHFDIPGAGPFVFNLSSPLPHILDEGIVIDGSTQPGSGAMNYLQLNTEIMVHSNNTEIYGLNLNNIVLQANNCKIGFPGKGNLIDYKHSTGTGLRLEGSYNLIQSNYFGTDNTGTIATTSDNKNAIIIGSENYSYYSGFSDNQIGGKRSLGEGNVCANKIVNSDGSYNVKIQGNNFGVGADDNTGLRFQSVGIELHERFGDNLIGGTLDEGNYFSNCGDAVLVDWNTSSYGWSTSENMIMGNKQWCNTRGIRSGANPTGSRPVIDSILPSCIKGTAEPFDIIEVFKNRTTCVGAPQGDEFLGQVTANAAGQWVCSPAIAIQAFDELVATATKPPSAPGGIKSRGETSDYSIAMFIQPDDCVFAQYLTVNQDECATTGIVLDLLQMTASSPGPVSSYANTFAGNDAWYKVEVPATGNFLVRTNSTNTVAPILEGYTGACGSLVFQQAVELDSLPHALAFENYTPGSIVYLRVWDRDNSIVNSGATSLLHLTAHELPINKDDWEMCDEENSIGNPSIISERDAATKIFNFRDTLTLAEIEEERDSLIAEGGTLKDSCFCGEEVIELWGYSDPVQMEGSIRGARRRARVDTANYNYLMEQREFQVNSYFIGEQYDCDVSMNNEADFIIAWTDIQRKNNYGRLFNSAGNPVEQEFLIGSNDKAQRNSSVFLKDNGEFIVVYDEIERGVPGAQYNIGGKEFYGSTIAATVGINISYNASADSNDTLVSMFGTNPQISGNSSDRFGVVWNNGPIVVFQTFDQLLDIRDFPGVVDTSDVAMPSPAIAYREDNSFIITWVREDSDMSGIYAQIYDSNRLPLGIPFLVNTYETGDQNNPDIDVTSNGSFTIVWESYEQEGAGLGYGIYARRFTSSGMPIDNNEFLVNTYTNDDQRSPSISLFDDGRMFVAWNSFGQDGDEEGIYGQFYSDNLSPVGAEFQLNTYTESEQEKPTTSVDGQTIVVGAWEDGMRDSHGKGIFGQRYEIINPSGQDVYYPIGTATPYTKLGDELAYPNTIYASGDSLSNVRVAIIDTGIDPNHPYLSGAIWNNQQVNSGVSCYVNDTLGFDFVNDIPNPIDYDGHGTQVNGIIARDFPSDIQLELMNLKFFEFNKGNVFDAICAIYYAVDNGADIINMSWGFEASETPSILIKAIQYASDNDVLLITTAGNTSKDNDEINKYPCNADIPHLIKVASYEYKATTDKIKLSNYSSYGKSNVDIAAYGFVETPSLGDTLALTSGTSLAAPHVTRTAAIIKGLFPNLTALDIKDCILNSAAPEEDLSNKVFTGGILDHEAALACAYDKASDCVAVDLQIVIPQPVDTVYRSDAWIEIEADIDSLANIETWGAHYVEMLPGFETIEGAVYLADIDDCDTLNSPFLLSPSETTEDIPHLRIEETSTKAGKIKVKFYYPGSGNARLLIRKIGTSKILKEVDFSTEKAGWHEYIMDAKEFETGQLQLIFRNKDKEEQRIIQIINKHYEKYKYRFNKAD